MKKAKTIWCYLDGKKHCDVVQWALAANVMVAEAKQMLIAQYPLREVAVGLGMPAWYIIRREMKGGELSSFPWGFIWGLLR